MPSYPPGTDGTGRTLPGGWWTSTSDVRGPDGFEDRDAQTQPGLSGVRREGVTAGDGRRGALTGSSGF